MADQQTAPRRALDRAGFTTAHPTAEGRIHLDLWPEGRAPGDDPVQFSLSAGQAIALIQKLADAAQRALKEVVDAR